MAAVRTRELALSAVDHVLHALDGGSYMAFPMREEYYAFGQDLRVELVRLPRGAELSDRLVHRVRKLQLWGAAAAANLPWAADLYRGRGPIAESPDAYASAWARSPRPRGASEALLDPGAG